MKSEIEPVPLTGELELKEFQVLPLDEATPKHVISYGKPFNINMTLDLSRISSPSKLPLDYSVDVIAKDLDGGRHFSIGKSEGSSLPSDPVFVQVENGDLPEGFYRLKAAVELRPSMTELVRITEMKAEIEGGLLRVY